MRKVSKTCDSECYTPSSILFSFCMIFYMFINIIIASMTFCSLVIQFASFILFKFTQIIMYLRYCVKFEVSIAVTMKNAVFWDVMPYGSCKNRCFGGT
jgi:hypothetical protein